MQQQADGTARAHWGSRLGFILAAAGSAVGLGNIWKFPYITGENGGGLFVVIYLVCIAIVGLPIMIAEVILGRASQRSPVGALERLAGVSSMWKLVGWMGVLTGFMILSFYSVVAGWSMHYLYLSLTNAFAGLPPEEIGSMFGAVFTSATVNLFWHFVFMAITIGIVITGVSRGIESAAKILMPALLLLMLYLLVQASFQPGFGKAIDFVFSPRTDNLTPAGVLEALGHSFFTLSLGMGAMITYGSYLSPRDDLAQSSVIIAGLDTFVALLSCMILFPITFSFGMEAEAGPGLVFASIPIALSQTAGGTVLLVAFFFMLFFAALSSAISLLEVLTSTAIEQFGWSRMQSTLGMGLTIAMIGVGCALSGVPDSFFNETWTSLFGKNFFDSFDYLSTNWLLPLGGLMISIYVGWFMPEQVRSEEFKRGSSLAGQYGLWMFFLRFIAPVGIGVLFLYGVVKPWL
ncbi:MAG: sodium-dependent transporter [Myxococcota bacterium]